MTYFRWRNVYDVIKLTSYAIFLSFTASYSIFKSINWPNQATSDHCDTQKIKTIRIFIFFLNFDLAKEGASALLAPPPGCALDGIWIQKLIWTEFFTYFYIVLHLLIRLYSNSKLELNSKCPTRVMQTFFACDYIFLFCISSQTSGTQVFSD